MDIDSNLIQNVKYSMTESYFISYEHKGEKKQITFNDIKKLWNDLSYDMVEGGMLYVWEEKIAFTVMIASQQGGVLFVWNAETNQFEHYSHCAYCIDFVEYHNNIYILHEISNYVTPCHYRVSKIPYGVKDVRNEGKMLYAEKPTRIIDNNEERVRLNIILKVKDHSLYIGISNQDILFAENLDNEDKSQPLEIDQKFYDNLDELSTDIVFGIIL